jgi:hypothetical protein
MILPAKAKTIKARANSLMQRRKRNDARKDTPKHTKHLDFQPHNPLKFKREGSRKTWMALKNSLILRLNFIM